MKQEKEKSKPWKNAEDYCNAVVRSENGDVGFLAWRFLIGCRILESLEDMMGCPEKGTDVQVIHVNQDHSKLRLGHYEISLAYKPEGLDKPLNEPNSE
jgi:hypothetical protein